MAKLTPLQKDELIQQYVELCVDGMDHKDMYHFIYNTLAEDFDKLTDSELQDEIKYSFDHAIYNVFNKHQPNHKLSIPASSIIHRKSTDKQYFVTVRIHISNYQLSILFNAIYNMI